ncbi:MAG: two-component regulator propeller domain-containing protein [Candidatus Cryptobacteroides sp.]
MTNRNFSKAAAVTLAVASILSSLTGQTVRCEVRMEGVHTKDGLYNAPGRFVSWNTSDGLPSDRILYIMEDGEGMIWLCTDRGLCRFDGTVFRVYGDKSSSGALQDCRTRCVSEGPGGCIWVGTESGLEKFDKASGNAEPAAAIFTEAGETTSVKSMFTDSDGSLWIHAGNGSIIHYNPDNQSIESTDFKGAFFEGDYWYDHIFKDGKGRIWAGGRAVSIAKIEDGDIGTVTYPVRNPDTEHFEGSAFAEDGRGNLYAADDKGLLSVYDSDREIFSTIFHIPVAAVCATADLTGRIWFGGRNGLIRMNPQMDGFDRFGHIASDKESVASNNIYCLCTDSRGNVWAGTDKGLSVFPAMNNAVTGLGMGNGLSSDSVTALMQDRDGLLWIGTEGNGVDTLNLKTFGCGNLKYELLSGNLPAKTREREKETLRQYALHKASADGSINENKVSALYQDSAGTIYIGLWSHVGFNTFDKKSGTFRRHCLWSVPAGYVFPLLLEGNLWGANWYTGFLEDSHGRMWCTTWEGVGLNLFDRENGRFTGVHFIPGDVPRMPRGTICSHVNDSTGARIYMAGGKWYGYFDLRTRDFHRYVENFPPGYPNGKLLDEYYSHSPAIQIDIPVNTLDLRVLDKHGDCVLVASANSLFEHDVTTGRVRVLYRPEKFRIEYSTFTSEEGIHVAWDGDTVTAVRSQGGNGYDVRSTALPDDCLPTPDGSRFSLGGDSLFVQTDRGSTIYIESQGRTIDISREAPRTLPSRLASCIAEDSEGFLWYGTTDSGLCRIDTSTGDIVSFRSEEGVEDSLPSDGIRDIYISPSGRIWAGTDKGLCSYSPEGRFVRAGETGSAAVKRVLEDRKGRLWLSTGTGLLCYDLSQDHVTSFHKCEGLRNESYSGAAAALADGRLAFGGPHGVDIIDPEAMISCSSASVLLDGFRTEEGPRYHCVPQSIRLRHRDNSFSVDFSTVLGSGLRMRYILEGFDRQWNYPDNGRVNIRYTNIPGGSYVLRAEVLDHSGIWYGRSVDIEVDPPLWLRWWFILAASAVTVLLILALIWLRERMLRAENRKLASLVDERTGQLKEQIESKNKFFSIVSHDLKNPIRSLDMLSYSLLQNWSKMTEEEKIQRTNIINSSAKGTSEILDDILTWAMSESGVIVAQKKTVVLKDAADAAAENLAAMCGQKNVRIVVEVAPSVKVSADLDMLSTILRNLLANAVKYSQNDSCVRVGAEYKDGKAFVSVTDTGVGMTPEIMEKLFRIDAKISVRGTSGEQGHGLGLITVHEFLKKMGEDITVESAPGRGSKFSFTLSVVDFPFENSKKHHTPD